MPAYLCQRTVFQQALSAAWSRSWAAATAAGSLRFRHPFPPAPAPCRHRHRRAGRGRAGQGRIRHGKAGPGLASRAGLSTKAKAEPRPTDAFPLFARLCRVKRHEGPRRAGAAAAPTPRAEPLLLAAAGLPNGDPGFAALICPKEGISSSQETALSHRLPHMKLGTECLPEVPWN